MAGGRRQSRPVGPAAVAWPGRAGAARPLATASCRTEVDPAGGPARHSPVDPPPLLQAPVSYEDDPRHHHRPLRRRRLHGGRRRQADHPQPRRDSGRVPLGLLGDLPQLGRLGSGDEGHGREDGRVRGTQGHAGGGRCGAAAQGLPGLRRDRQAPVPHLSLSAAAARRRHPRPGHIRAIPAGRRRLRQVRHRHRLVHARAAGDPGGDRRRLDRADAGARALPLHHPRQLPAEGARPRRQGRAAALARRAVQHRAASRSTPSSPPPTSSSRRSSSPTARRWC